MKCIRPNLDAKKYAPRQYRGMWVMATPNAASQPMYGARREGERLMFAGPFRTSAEAEAAIDGAMATGCCGEASAPASQLYPVVVASGAFDCDTYPARGK